MKIISVFLFFYVKEVRREGTKTNLELFNSRSELDTYVSSKKDAISIAGMAYRSSERFASSIATSSPITISTHADLRSF